LYPKVPRVTTRITFCSMGIAMFLSLWGYPQPHRFIIVNCMQIRVGRMWVTAIDTVYIYPDLPRMFKKPSFPGRLFFSVNACFLPYPRCGNDIMGWHWCGMCCGQVVKESEAILAPKHVNGKNQQCKAYNWDYCGSYPTSAAGAGTPVKLYRNIFIHKQKIWNRLHSVEFRWVNACTFINYIDLNKSGHGPSKILA